LSGIFVVPFLSKFALKLNLGSFSGVKENTIQSECDSVFDYKGLPDQSVTEAMDTISAR
jgi:hypothetical protein